MTAPGTTAVGVGAAVANGLRTVNFFNGRLLTAGDLQREQDTARALRGRLGVAVGDGVVRGLRVTRPGGPDPRHPVVDVTAGVAVAPSGAALELADDVRVTLVGAAAAPATTAASPSLFTACSGLPDGAPLTVAGVYLLTVSPAGTPVGRAVAGGLGAGPGGCDVDACADGVAFRLVHLSLDAAVLADGARLRNRLAQLMFGTDDPRRTRLARDPFGTPAGDPGLLADLRDRALAGDEVPLACLLWTPGVGIGFVDEWCVRRGVAAGGADPDMPEITAGTGRERARARLLQFQAQLADLAHGAAGAPQTVRAADVFDRLPPAGVVPLATSAVPAGFDATRFLSGMTTRPGPGRDPLIVDGARLPALLEASLSGEPIDPAAVELVWVYLVRQNTTSPVQPYLVFASGHLPPIADARFDLARFDVANHALDGSHGKDLA